LALELTDDAKVAIELYLKQINEKNEEQRQKRITLYTTIIGVFIAAFTGILIGLLAWALSNITSGTHDAAVLAAKQETQRLLETPPVLQTISSHITQANDAALKATQSAAGAHAAASEAEDSLKSLQTTLAADKEVVSAIKDLSKFVDDIAKNPTFQNAVSAKLNELNEPIKKRIDDLDGQLAQIKKFAPFSFTAHGCEVGHEVGILFALHDSNVTPAPPSVFSLAGENAAGLVKHEWAQLHVCAW
jgi:hypothetical protein